MTSFFRGLLVFAVMSLFIASGSVCKLGSDDSASITNDPTPTSSSFHPPSPTPTPDQGVLLQVTSSPAGTLVELNPQEGDRGYMPGTGRAVGSTPLEIHVTPS